MAENKDLVEVVRCKDCKKYMTCHIVGYNSAFPHENDDWYCADGERGRGEEQ